MVQSEGSGWWLVWVIVGLRFADLTWQNISY